MESIDERKKGQMYGRTDGRKDTGKEGWEDEGRRDKRMNRGDGWKKNGWKIRKEEINCRKEWWMEGREEQKE